MQPNLFFRRLFRSPQVLLLLWLALTLPLVSYWAQGMSFPASGWKRACLIHLTSMGDGFFAVLVVLYLILFREDRRDGEQMALAVVITLILVQGVKNIHYGFPVRLYFEPIQRTPFTPGDWHAILSGHAAIIFCMVTQWVRTGTTNRYAYGLYLLAAVVAISRIPMAGENMISVMLGSFIGLLVPYLLQGLRRGLFSSSSFFSTDPQCSTDTPPLAM